MFFYDFADGLGGGAVLVAAQELVMRYNPLIR